jgi:hypothetical protein
MKNISSFIEWLQKNAVKSFDNRKDLLKELVKDEEWYLTITISSTEKWRYKLNRKLSKQFNEWFSLAFNDFEDWDPEDIEEAWNELKLSSELKFLKQLWDKGCIDSEVYRRDTCDDENYPACVKFYIGVDIVLQFESFNFADMEESSIKDENFEKFFEENKEHLCSLDKWDWVFEEAAAQEGVSVEDYKNKLDKEEKLLRNIARKFEL